MVQGRARGAGTVARLFKRNSPEVTAEHCEAAHRLLLAWSGCTIGYSARSMTGEGLGRASAGPSQGPNATALHQWEDARTVARALRAVGPAAVPLVRFVVLDGGDVQAWAKLQTATTGRRHCAKCAMGRLLQCLDLLVVALDVPDPGKRDRKAA